MLKKVFFLVGGSLIVTGIFVSIILHVSLNNSTDSNEPAWLSTLLSFGIGGFLVLLGTIFILAGFRSRAREKKEKELYDHIMLTGIAAEAQITYVDRNYTVRVNNRPIYSIVEYTYTDRSGKPHTKSYNYHSTEWVIRNQIQVGKTIAIKYAAEDADKSIIVM